jgi:hypothetical protein
MLDVSLELGAWDLVLKTHLLLLRHVGKMASTAGIAPATSTFARWRSDLAELRGQMASVAGLAPARTGLKGRLLDLLCIHGPKKRSDGVLESWSVGTGSPGPHHSAIFGVVPEVGIAPTSPRLQRGANLPQLLGEPANGVLE